ncbi:putative FAD-linked oxidoreductase [Corynebacterium atrinae]|uniref:FAD-binding and (Fe-S)-binding domain-containing protein n=1 Tax=Corynebacterium atrinae TaxID=1336740 RepID=UPI0025B5D5E0|nr:FAD-binding and (Fe-S)-binding domain-containing protein [Corynebacterium atrinae]WJY62873.1 putative FAD-linked oxidoreductase [Corynebacterium atrinae]
MTPPLPRHLRRDMPTRAAYSSDASIYRRVPAAIAEPESVEDIRTAVAYAQARGWPIVARGGGSSVAGNAIGDGLIIDTSRHFNRIISIDPEARTATVEPGVVCDQLRDAAATFGLTYGPDPSTHSRCTIGGMVANNACGSHSVAYGTSADNLVSVTLLLADGREVQVTAKGCDDPAIDAQLRELAGDNRDLIAAELGRFPRQVSGYGLHYLATDMAKAIAGSEGTLGIITQLTVSLVEKPHHTALAVLAFGTVFDAAGAAVRALLPGVATVEGMGGDLLAALRSKNGQEHAGSMLPGGEKAGGWLFCETSGATLAEALALAQTVADECAPTGSLIVSDPQQMRELWWIREASAGLVTRLPDGGEAWPSWEDSAVPPEHLADYLRDLYALMARHGLRGIPFGHFGEGCVHVRISFDFSTDEGVRVFRQFMEDAAVLVTSYGGSLSGEHGDGRARSELLGHMYSPEMLALFQQFKAIFDPTGVFNPGVLVAPEAVTQGIRLDQGQRSLEITPIHALSHDQGSLINAVNRCVGVSACRSASDAMCPTFQLTGDELDSTRGRARVLSEVFRGESVDVDDAVEALDLCLSCKACASECPVNVDMATYKAELLHHRYDKRRRPMAHYVMGWLPISAFLMQKIPGAARLVNAVFGVPRLARAIATVAGLDAGRPLIRFANTPLRRWAKKRAQTSNGSRVVLWPDTFNSSLDTGASTAAVEVLERLGFDVIIPPEFVCCGLTWHSTGQLTTARKVLRHSAQVMRPYLDEGLPVIGLEPSCTVMLQREATELSDDVDVARLSAAVIPFADVIAPRITELVEEGLLEAGDLSVLTQVHCHERSLGTPENTSALLDALGIDEEQIQTGCCGLAGNWGFEKGHAEMSFQLGERELFPRVRVTEGQVHADGFSCRTHIEQGTGTQAKHTAELVRDVLVRAGIDSFTGSA